MLPASTRRCSVSSLTCKTTALRPSGLDGPAAMVPGAEDPSLVARRLSPHDGERVLPGWRNGIERQHPHGCFLVCAQHGCKRPSYRRTLVGGPNHHHWRFVGHAECPNLPAWAWAQIKSSSLGTSLAVRSSFLVMANLTSAACATALAFPRALAIAMARLPAFARDCDGNCILDADGDGICDDEDDCLPGVS